MPKLSKYYENLWELGGKPTSYNPLPSGWNNYVKIGFEKYKITFKAKSQSSARLNVYNVDGVYEKHIYLTPTLMQYSYDVTVTHPSNRNLYFYDLNSTSDIIITDIKLTRVASNKAKGILRSNLIFRELPSGVKDTEVNGEFVQRVSDDYVLQAGDIISVTNDSNVSYARTNIPFKTDAKTGTSGIDGIFRIGNMQEIATQDTNKVESIGKFHVRSDGLILFPVGLGTTLTDAQNALAGLTLTYQLANPVETPITPRVANMIPKKNLFDKNQTITQGKYVDTNTGNLSSHSSYKVSDYFIIEPNKTHIRSIVANRNFAFYDSNKNFISGGYTQTFTTPSNAKFMRQSFGIDDDLNTFQLEKGTVATPHEPYTLVLKQAR